MCHRLVVKYTQRIAEISSDDVLYSKKIKEILEEMTSEEDISKERLIDLFSVLITRDKIKHKEIKNKTISELDYLLETKKDLDTWKFNDMYHECIKEGPTERVLNYIERIKTDRNYHQTLCEVCNPDCQQEPNIATLPEVSRESLRLLLCIFAMKYESKQYAFMHVDAKRSFLPLSNSGAECKISTIPSNKIAHKIQAVLVQKLGYSPVKDTPCLFYHSDHGLALSSRWEILFLSKRPSYVRRLLLDFFIMECMKNRFTFMDFKIEHNSYALRASGQEYIETKIPEIFDDEQTKKYITSYLDSKKDTSDLEFEEDTIDLDVNENKYFHYLESPPFDDPKNINGKFIQNEKQYGGLTWPEEFPSKNLTPSELHTAMGVINYITTNFRWDLQYHAAVLTRYINHPNKLVFVNVVNTLRMIYSTAKLSSDYDSQSKYSKLTVDISCISQFQPKNPGSTYLSYMIHIGGHYRHSKSKLIKTIVNGPLVAKICAAYEAVEYVVLHHSMLKTLEMTFEDKLKYNIYVDDKNLIDFLDGTREHKLNAIYEKRLNTLKRWLQDYHIKVCYADSIMSPAGVLSSESNFVRNSLFDGSFELGKEIEERFMDEPDDYYYDYFL